MKWLSNGRQHFSRLFVSYLQPFNMKLLLFTVNFMKEALTSLLVDGNVCKKTLKNARETFNCVESDFN